MFTIDKLSLSQAKELSEWKYEDEYSIYNYPDWDIMIRDKWAITDVIVRNNEFRGVFIDNQLIGYFRLFTCKDKLFIGLGMKPSFCGQGNGYKFMHSILKYYLCVYPDKILNLKVRTFNERAIKLYKKLGFRIVNNTLDDEFIYMEYDAP